MPHSLIVDDDRNFSSGLSELVMREGFTTGIAHSLKEARAELGKTTPDVTLVDLNLPDGSGLDLLRDIEAAGTGGQVILITGHASIDTAVEALRRGASDYLTKPVDFARVKAVLANIVRTRELREEIGNLRGELRELGRFGPLIGASPAMQKVYDLITKVAQTDATVLLYGETGTGKELVAQTIHQLSRRRKEAFLPINCGAVSPNLIETGFGHERGSFTGADRLHKGYFERADRGTLLLDEITEMPIELQVKLLRVLETSKVTRIGGSQAFDVDVRVIAATNVRPEEAVSKGKLREDLLYRLNIFPIQLPHLRDRKEDVELLGHHFLAQLNKEHGTRKEFSRVALQRLRAHNWPGSVRELRNAVHRAFIMAEDEITMESLPLGSQETPGSALQIKVGTSIAEVERRLIMATLEQCSGDKKQAAQILGVSVKTLYNRLNEFKDQ